MDALWLVPTLPLAGFLILTVFGGLLDRNAQAVVGVGSVGASAVAAAVTALVFMIHPPGGSCLPPDAMDLDRCRRPASRASASTWIPCPC